jgi:hypothetical protein
MIGRRPYAAFGNSVGDPQMLEYTRAGGGARLAFRTPGSERFRKSCMLEPWSVVGAIHESSPERA